MWKKLQHSFQNTILVTFNLSSSYFFIITYIILSTNLHYHVQAHVFIYASCSQDKFQPNSPYEANLNSVFSSITNSASQSNYNSFAVGNVSSTPSEDAAYGLYQCRGDLKTVDCAACVRNAVGQIGLVCSYTYAASLQLEGCLVRYENHDFLGKLDTTVVYRKCSRSTTNDVEFYKRRDDVLADLQAATSFRVISLGFVEGFAQCLTDLSQVDCSSCLSEAVGKLKNVCGPAAAADVYLAQCYARYWASGYYDSDPDSSNEDNIGKTVAIIVGVLAGFAIIVVMLSLIRKASTARSLMTSKGTHGNWQSYSEGAAVNCNTYWLLQASREQTRD
ncbi:Cysteine-rich repeat secretory protein [Thalictrum thalictroides]|uniref:Cysteine-rich repeat secretory protein n=1 Tax=Thalictrum thalictroides TaxID=46969 RepID=A0A7J6V6A0_THATH|nr:Cysteine-rich repeat secretory protein [Thalictrum thalictroides]